MKNPTLYLVPTPLGNLKDITLRALEVLRDADLIVCEDTRHTRKLLTHYGIAVPLVACNRFSEARRADYILGQLEEGKTVAMVSDAGTPAVSDPGSRLVTQARSRGVRVEALPGPSALITAFSASGFDLPLRFIGFFPRSREAMEQEIRKMSITHEVTVFYESPLRLTRTLDLMHAAMPHREICVARELTKIHEEYLVGTVEEVLRRVMDTRVRGEITVLVKGSSSVVDLSASACEDTARELLEQGHSRRDVLRLLSRETGITRNELYRMLLSVKKTVK
ncbi:MAG TPA: 16S rRNA (cytidine(1402)-2'-O)-methyltransferase [Deltaproteobacteria bacterium]|nr:16S rRNA (cytidine(1402)-2'-O)-methyltransferase [Deltaproteobacteria bacterium]HQI80850.1 16S rRNA (cytidine(1402)-2'-O)-methyltransferase [Deltaproteobacteria bacterium]